MSMIKALILLATSLLMLPSGSNKYSLKNSTLKDPKQQILFVNVKNKIKVSGMMNDTNYRITSKYCYVALSKPKEHTFTLFPKGFTKKTDTLKIVRDDKVLAEFPFKIDTLSSPKAFINGVPNKGKVKIDKLKADHKFLIKESKHPQCNCNYTFQSYTLISKSGQATKTLHLRNESQMVEAWKVVDFLHDGDYIFVKNIVLQSETCGTLNMPDYSFTIIE